jgi:RNA polymerase sigma-70 factor
VGNGGIRNRVDSFIIDTHVINNPLETATDLLADCAPELAALYEQCCKNASNYGVEQAAFESTIRGAIEKYLVDASCGRYPSPDEVKQFLGEIQSEDLFLAIGCAQGSENAWWDFDCGYRRYIERVARHLASAESDAEEVIDHVYVELYGTRVVDGARQSKFSTYTGRGTLRGWLRTIVWHAVIDMHRARREEVPIDDWTESGGESQDRPGYRATIKGGESDVFDRITKEKYGTRITAALDTAFSRVEEHEKLLLLYYHVENLKLREIARLVERPNSPLRRWFQRQSKKRSVAPESRVHESTVMRWLERTYGKLLAEFKGELKLSAGLSAPEIEMCVELAASDFGSSDVRKHLVDISEQEFGKERAE